MNIKLNKREGTILCNVIEHYIKTATPIGSQFISERLENKLSSATIRNVMYNLEDLGFLTHPHVSAGRVPTELGYRAYVDELMEPEKVSALNQKYIFENLKFISEPKEILKITAKIISSITNQLAIITFPKFEESILQKIELIELSSNKFVILLSLDGGIIKTLILEMNEEIPISILNKISRELNEKLSNLKLSEIKETFKERIKDSEFMNLNITKIFIDSADKIFEYSGENEIYFDIPTKMLNHPEFENTKQFQAIIELLDKKEIIIQFLNKVNNTVEVKIGSESGDKRFKNFSVVYQNYTMGKTKGSIGVIGPTRMQYTKVVPVIDYISNSLSSIFISLS